MTSRFSHELLLIFAIYGASYSCFADDPLIINHKHRRRSSDIEHDPRLLNFRFVHEPSNAIASSDGSALLDCKFAMVSPPPTSPVPIEDADDDNTLISNESSDEEIGGLLTRVEWRKEGSPIHPLGRIKLISNGSLWIESVMPVDEGQYQCAVHVITQQQQHQHTGADQHGKESHWIFLSRRASLSLPSLHRFEQQPTDQHARIGQMAAFRCLLNSKPLAQIEWHHDNRLLKNGEGGYLVLPVSQTLEISHVRSEHAGVYKCVARNGDRSRTSQLGTLTVLDGEESPQSMHWVLEPRNQLVTVGDSVLLECLANNGGARQSTKIQWLHNSEPLASSAIDGGKPLNNNDDGAAAAAAAADVAPSSSSTSSVFAMVGRRRTHLLIRNVSAQTAGQYTCRAQNALRTQDVGATVAVRVSPTITIRPVDVLTQETNDVEFECVAEGVPTPRITWNKNGEVIIPSEYFVIASNKLRIFGLVRDDQGVYQCIADNEVGTEQAAAQLLVDQAASHLPLISPSSDDSVRALVVPKTPAQALSLRATDTGAQSVQLRWDAPLNNQKFGPITHYIVAYREEGSTRERTLNSSDTQQTLDNLRPQTSYSVRVIAVNLVGPGTPSDALLITTKKQESLPGKVRSLRAEVLSSESIQVQWDEPTPIDASSNLDIRYKLFYVKVAENVTGHENEEDTEEDDDDDEDGDDASSETQVLMVKTSYTLHGVAKNAPYSIRVEAENVHGAGPSSEPFVVRTWPDTPSAPPRDVQADSLPQPGHAIRVRWRPPPRAQWNSDALIGHKLRYRMKGGRPPGGGKATASTVLVEEEEGEDDDDGMEGWWTHTLDGLEPGSPYLIRVAAVNQNGTGPWTDWTAVDTPEEQKEESQISGAPSELRVLASHDSVQVSWLPPRDDNVLIRGYLVGWGINIPDVEKATVEPEVRHFTIRGLKPNREYVISLRAFNRIGHGFPIYETVKTSSYGVHSSSVSSSSIADPKPTFGGFGHQNDNANSLPAPVGVVAEAISSSQMRLTWIDPNENAFNQLYTIKYGMSNTDEAQYKLLNSTETEHTFDGLRPDTLFEFAVRLAQSPHWSLNAVNRTFPAPPSSPPRDLTVIGPQSGRPHEDSDPSMVTLTWQPPKYANGEIQEYIVLYSDRPNLPDRDWVMDSVKGDRLSIAMRKLRPDRIYHFKLQARNVKGYGPFTPVASFTTATTFPPFGGADPNRSSVDDDSDSNTSAAILFGQFFDGMRSNLAFVLIGVVVVVVLLLVVALLAACFQRSKNDHNVRASATMSNRSQRRHKKQRNRSQQQSYIPGRKMSVSTPSAVAELDDDLWMIHQQPQQHNAGGGGGRFATLINASAIEDFESAATVDDGTGILLIDGQQRAFIAPSGAAGLNLQSAAMECLTPAHYQQAFHAATTQRQVNSVGTLPRGHPNHHQHLHNSSASLEMKSAPQPLHLHQQQQNHYVQQQHQQQQQQQQLGNTPLTPRNPHVVYTRVNRQPIAKVDFSMNGAATAAATTTVPPHDSPHYQQRHQFVGGAVSSASAAGGTPPLPAPPSSSLTGACASRTATTTSSTTIISNHPQHNRNSSEGGYQTVGGGRGNCGTMRSFVDAGTTEDDGNGSCEALPVPSTGEQHHEQQQQQRMAHIVRPIVYAGGCGGGGGIAGGASPSPSTLRSAVAQKTTPTTAHKFTYNNNGAKVPVGRATAQPRVNLATAAVAAAANLPSDVTALYGYSAASPSQYANVRAAAAAANAVNTGGTKNSMEHGGGGGELYINNNNISSSKTIDSTEDLEEIDHMIETLQQLQQGFTEGSGGGGGGGGNAPSSSS